MSTIATITAKTYKATIDSTGTCTVRGIAARAIVTGATSTKQRDRQRALREEIAEAAQEQTGDPKLYVADWNLA